MRSPTLTVVAAAAFVLGALTYSSWVMGWWANPGLNSRTSYVSELAAQDQVHSLWFRLADAVAGLAVAAGGALQFVAWRRSLSVNTYSPAARRTLLAAMGAAVAFGVATVADAASPLSCAPTHDAACRAAESAGAVTWTHQLHLVSSTAANTSALTMMVAVSIWLRLAARDVEAAGSGPHIRWVERLALDLPTAVALLTTVWTLGAMAFDPSTLGIAQRLEVASIAVWLVGIVWCMRPTTGRGPRTVLR